MGPVICGKDQILAIQADQEPEFDGSEITIGGAVMSVYQCSVCDPNDPCILPRAGQLAECPDTCPWSKERNIPVWRKLVVGE